MPGTKVEAAEGRTERAPAPEQRPARSTDLRRYADAWHYVDEAVPEEDIVVREYEDAMAYQRDLTEFAKIGYVPILMTAVTQRAGLARGLLLWIMALVWSPAPHLVVTYRREP